MDFTCQTLVELREKREWVDTFLNSCGILVFLTTINYLIILLSLLEKCMLFRECCCG